MSFCKCSELQYFFIYTVLAIIISSPEPKAQQVRLQEGTRAVVHVRVRLCVY